MYRSVRPLRWIPLLVLTSACAANGPRGPAPASVGVAEAARTITAGEMVARIGALAHDSMMGRDTPSPGLEKAAGWLAARFDSFGLEPAGEDGFLQRYPLSRRALDTASVHFGTVDGSGSDNRMLRHGVDFWTSPAHVPPGVDMFHGRFAWVGRPGEGGLPAGEYGGTIVVVDRPGAMDRDWRRAVGRARTEARSAGATALLVVADADSATVARLAERSAGPRAALGSAAGIPVFHLTREAFGAIAAREGTSIEALPIAPPAPVVFENVRSHFAAEAVTVSEDRPANVAAVLRGSDPALADTYVVLTAHYDHVGVGTADAAGDSIYNGADDDASGTAALVEAAQAFAALSERPARSVLFLAVSGEEKGLLGSRWYSENPTVPIESIVANVNIDMIARNAPDSIVVIGQEYSSLGAVVREAAEAAPELGLTVSPDLWPEERFFFRSDHFNFARKEIPALFFFAGVHEDYHRPSDEVEDVDGEKAARVARLVFRTAWAIADDPEPPRWRPEGLEAVRALTR